MSIEILYSDPGGVYDPTVTTDLGTAVVRFGHIGLSQAAVVGEPAVSSLEIDDPAGSLTFVGLRHMRISETSAPSNNRVIYSGSIQGEHINRIGSMRTGAARRWTLDLADQNWVIANRVFTDASAKRPAETSGDRLRWVLAANHRLHDFGHVTYPTAQMDACDYRGQTIKDLIADCAAAGTTAYNFWAEGNEAHAQTELFFMDPNGSSYTSTLRISNDYDDYDGSTTFVPYEDAQLDRSPSRIAAGVYLPFEGGAVYVRNETTAAQFADVDQAAPMANVKTAAMARVIANRLLADNDEEDDTVGVAIKVPKALVNIARAGQLIEAKFTHFDGWEDFRPCRVLRRTVMQDDEGGQDYYRLVMDLSPAGASPASCSLAFAARVTASRDSQLYASHIASLPITTTADPSMIVAAAVLKNSNTPDTVWVTGGGFTQIYAANLEDTGTTHPLSASMYRAVVSADTYTATGSYTPGFSPSDASTWGMAAVAFGTGATEPVQTSPPSEFGTADTDGEATFTSQPTSGHLLIATIVLKDMSSDADIAAVVMAQPGWTRLATAKAAVGIGTDCVIMFGKCAGAGEALTFGVTGLSKAGIASLSEWEITGSSGSTPVVEDEAPADPEAGAGSSLAGVVGFGLATSGGDGFPPYHVTNLSDSGAGSLRDAVSQSDRYIVFDVEGEIALGSQCYVTGHNLTIDGSTAPGDGITLSGHTLYMDGGGSHGDPHDIIIYNLRHRGGWSGGQDADCITIARGAYNIVLKNLSVSGYFDEGIDCWDSVHDVTIQDCIIGPGGDPAHNYAALVGKGSNRITYYRNLFRNTNYRNPAVGNDDDTDAQASSITAHVVNNLVYGFLEYALTCYHGGAGNFESNYTYSSAYPANNGRSMDVESSGRAYVSGNYSQDGANLDGQSNHARWAVSSYADVTASSAADAADYVVLHAGCFPRDATDLALIPSIP